MGKINFGKIPGNKEFNALPEDRYVIECIKAELQESKNGNPKINCQFKVLGEKFNNRRVFHNFSLMPNALFNLKIYMEKAKLEIPEGDIDIEAIPKILVGTKVTAFAEIYKSNDKQYNNLKNWGSVEKEKKGNLFF